MRSSALFLGICALIPQVSFAATFQVSDYVFLAIPVVDDLYAAGETVSVKQKVSGDAIIGGGEVVVTGAIEQDLIAAGGDVTVSGAKGDDARIAGGTIILSSVIDDDLIIAGGNIHLTDSANIKGDLRVYGGNVTIDGTVGGNLQVRAGRFVFNGSVNGETDVRVDELRFRGSSKGNAILAAKELDIDDAATFGNDLTYWQPDGPYYFGSAAVKGKTLYDETLAFRAEEEFEHAATGAFSVALLGMFGYGMLASALIMVLKILLTKTYYTDVAKRFSSAPGMNTWYGFLYFIVTPIVGILFMATVIGIPVGLLLLGFYLFTVIFAKAFSAPVIAKWLLVRYNKKWGSFAFFLASLGTYVVLCGLMLIPVLGWIALWILICMSYGAMSVTELSKMNKVR